MTVRLDGSRVRLEGDCHVDQAETLVELLLADRSRTIDLAECRQLHSAMVQVLLVFRPKIEAPPVDPYLRDHILPNLSYQHPSTPENLP